ERQTGQHHPHRADDLGERREAVMACLVLLVMALEGPTLPAPLGKVPHPKDNPPTPAKVALGKKLFFDARLSRTGKVSCATCHDQNKEFTTGGLFPLGFNGRRGKQNVPSLFNVGHSQSFFWDGRAAPLEAQALAPIDTPAKMDMRPAALAEK